MFNFYSVILLITTNVSLIFSCAYLELIRTAVGGIVSTPNIYIVLCDLVQRSGFESWLCHLKPT